MNARRIVSGVVCALLALPTSAQAWESSSKWSNREVGFRVNPTNLDVPPASALAAIRSTAAAWTAQTRAGFRFRYDGTSTSTAAGYDGQNVVLFRNEQGSSSTTRATTMTWKLGSSIVEMDMIFWDKSMHFVTQGMTCAASIYIENTAIHEFGHALGLDHTPVTTASMYALSKSCAKDRLALDADDVAGVESLYPCTSASQCNDGNSCTTDTCQSGKCKRAPIAGCCSTASDCNDGNACTADTCVANICTHSAVSCAKPDAGADASKPDAGADASKPGADASSSGGDAEADDPSDPGSAAPTGGGGGSDPGRSNVDPDPEPEPAAPEADTAAETDGGCSTSPPTQDGAWSWAGLMGALALVLRVRLRRRPS